MPEHNRPASPVAENRHGLYGNPKTQTRTFLDAKRARPRVVNGLAAQGAEASLRGEVALPPIAAEAAGGSPARPVACRLTF